MNLINRCLNKAALFAALFVIIPFVAISQESNIVDSLMRKMSIRDKVAQLCIIEFHSKDKPKERLIKERLVKHIGVGGLIIMNDKLNPCIDRINSYHKIAKYPLLITIDGEWGASMRFKEIPPFPRQMQLGALNSDSLVYKMGYLIGKECNDLNIHVNFAPDIDINNNPSNPVINTRSFGENKEKVALYGAAYMLGMQHANVAGSAKHFPGHGDTDIDSHKALPILPFSKERLDSLELYPFRYLIESNVDMVMVGHLEIPALDVKRTPSSISKPIVTGLLREELGFNNIICTDALNMDGVAKSRGLTPAMVTLNAFKAGADILLMPEDVENSINAIVRAIHMGEVSVKALDERVRKVLNLKVKCGLFNNNYSPYIDTLNLEQKLIKQENIELINQIAKQSLTLLFNSNDKYALPLQPSKLGKIGYLGCGSELYAREFVEVCKSYAEISPLFLDSPYSYEQLQMAKDSLKDCDIIITAFNNTDARPQLNFGIDSLQMDFITNWAKEKPMHVIYFGSPYALSKIPNYRNFKSFIVAYTNTLANNFAGAQIIFGAIPTLGVLPVATCEFKEGYSVILNNIIAEELFEYPLVEDVL